MTLNKQGPDKIDWCDFSWNPISGCLTGCDYCYCQRNPWISMDPKFHPDRLTDPIKRKKPAKIFVGSSGDMWGTWVDQKWISIVLDACLSAPQHTFQFSTKNPKRYTGFQLPENGWYGTTVDGTWQTERNCEILSVVGRGYDLYMEGEWFKPDSRAFRMLIKNGRLLLQHMMKKMNLNYSNA